MIPSFELKRNYNQVRKETLAALDKVLESSQFILGPAVAQFEEEAAAYLGTSHALGCASGSDALLLALHALDVGPGDKVVTTPFTFFASVSAITRLGATPLFVDVKEDTYLLDPQALLEAMDDPAVKVVMPVHLFGQMVELDEVMAKAKAKGIKVVEDTAQAFGAARRVGDKIIKAGTWGDIGGYSFFPTKNLGCFGDGGMVSTDDEALFQRLSRLRVHGAGDQYYHDEVGYNSRLDAMQAAVLSVRLRYLEEWTEARRAVAQRYELMFAQKGLDEFVTLPREAANNRHVYHQYVVRAKDRDALQAHMTAQGVATRVYYPLSLHLQRCFAFLGYQPGQMPVSERLTSEVLALPMFPELTADEQQQVVDAVAKFYR